MNISTFIKDFITLKGNVYTYLNSVFNNNSNLDISSIITIFKNIIDNIFLELESLITLGIKKSLESLYPIKNIDFSITNLNFITPIKNNKDIFNKITPNLPKIIKYSNGKFDYIPASIINFKITGNLNSVKKNIRHTINFLNNYMEIDSSKSSNNFTILKFNNVGELKYIIENHINNDINIVNYQIHQKKFTNSFECFYMLVEHKGDLSKEIYSNYIFYFKGATRYHYEKFMKNIGPQIDAEDL